LKERIKMYHYRGIICEDIISASMSGNVWNTGTGDCYGNSRSEEFDI
jgi:hypothetical protein